MKYKPLNQRIMERLQEKSDNKDGIEQLKLIQDKEFLTKLNRFDIIREVELYEMIRIFNEWFKGLWNTELHKINIDKIPVHASIVHFDNINDIYLYLLQTPYNRYILISPGDIQIFYGYKLFEVST